MPQKKSTKENNLATLLRFMLLPFAIILQQFFALASALTYPFRYAHYRLFSKPRREALYLRQWDEFVVANRDKIDAWIKTHDESSKLPVVRNHDGSYRWLTRNERRRATRSIEQLMS